PVSLGTDVRRPAVAADVGQRARGDEPLERLDRRERRARAGREIAVRAPDVAHDRRFEFRWLAVAGEGRAVNTLPRLSGKLLCRAGRRDRCGWGAAYEG